jgi:hypothetical protein
VHYIDLTIEGQLLCMAYMDVAPAGAANGKTVVLFHGKRVLLSLVVFPGARSRPRTAYIAGFNPSALSLMGRARSLVVCAEARHDKPSAIWKCRIR